MVRTVHLGGGGGGGGGGGVHLAAALVCCPCGLEAVDVPCLASGAASKRTIDGCWSEGQTDGRRVVTVDQATSARVAPRSEVVHNPDVCSSFVCVYIRSVGVFKVIDYEANVKPLWGVFNPFCYILRISAFPKRGFGTKWSQLVLLVITLIHLSFFFF